MQNTHEDWWLNRFFLGLCTSRKCFRMYPLASKGTFWKSLRETPVLWICLCYRNQVLWVHVHWLRWGFSSQFIDRPFDAATSAASLYPLEAFVLDQISVCELRSRGADLKSVVLTEAAEHPAKGGHRTGGRGQDCLCSHWSWSYILP